MVKEQRIKEGKVTVVTFKMPLYALKTIKLKNTTRSRRCAEDLRYTAVFRGLGLGECVYQISGLCCFSFGPEA